MQITVTGIDRIKQRIDRLANLKERLAEVSKRLCEVGEPIIQAAHGGHAVITTEPTENGYVIRAEGEDVLFVEFGTGDATGIMAKEYDQVPAVVRPGNWSEAHGGEYAATGGYLKGHWHFAGRELHETEPNPSFYYAYQAMVEALPQIANEVFSK